MIPLLLLACAAPETPTADPAADTGAMPMEEQMLEAYASAEVCATCHQRQYEEWRQSMHAYASISPIFEALALKAFRDSSGQVGTFCTGCHSQYGELEGNPGNVSISELSPLARQGISCDSCHSAVGHQGLIQNSALELDPMGPRFGPFSDPVENDYHASEYSDFTTSPELCGTCHDVRMYPGIDLEEAYTEYINGPAPQRAERCQDCHMSPNPGVPGGRPWGPAVSLEGDYPDREQASHRFIGPDYSLIDEFPYPDDLERSAAAQAEYEELRQTLLRNSIQIKSAELSRGEGQHANLVVEVESLTTGHNVPTGFTSERQLWLHVEVTDQDGELVFESGALDSYGDLRDLHSWDVIAGEIEEDTQLVNYQSQNILVQHNYDEDGTFSEGDHVTTTDSVFPMDATYIVKRGLEPLEVRPHTYTFPLASGTQLDDLTVEVTLRFRNLPPYILRALFADEFIPRLRTVDIDTALASVADE